MAISLFHFIPAIKQPASFFSNRRHCKIPEFPAKRKKNLLNDGYDFNEKQLSLRLPRTIICLDGV
jgi:hypothetical protein